MGNIVRQTPTEQAAWITELTAHGRIGPPARTFQTTRPLTDDEFLALIDDDGKTAATLIAEGIGKWVPHD